MELSQEQNIRLKEIELDILKSFVSICQDQGLRYYLTGGTLLGAIRHKGFIPWDDDIDVAMPREDYERFLEIGQDLLPPEYFLQTRQTDKAFPANFAKIRDCRTTFIEKSLKDVPVNHGVYIDVFPLDYFPEKPLHQKWKTFWWSLSRIRAGQALFNDVTLSLKQRIIRWISRVCYGTPERALNKLEKMMRSLPTGSLYINYCGAWGVREIIPVTWFGEGTEVEFEGMRVCGPTNYDAVLSQLYGDYMTLPPPEKRIAHHYTEVVDLEKPYTEYCKN